MEILGNVHSQRAVSPQEGPISKRRRKVNQGMQIVYIHSRALLITDISCAQHACIAGAQ